MLIIGKNQLWEYGECILVALHFCQFTRKQHSHHLVSFHPSIEKVLGKIKDDFFRYFKQTDLNKIKKSFPP